jgi:hypothetical protein
VSLLPFLVIMFNRPKFLVSPYLRDQRGALMPCRSCSARGDN